MKTSIPPGAVFGAWTVQGPASPEVQDGHVFVRAECWSCKTRHDVRADNLRNGTSKRCGDCSRAMRSDGRFRTRTDAAPYLQALGSMDDSIGELEVLG